jgi:hypothetical protein
MEREFSAGGVVLRKMRGRWFMAVIEPHMDRPKEPVKKSAGPGKKDPKPIVALPKGAIDDGEKPEQTALRRSKKRRASPPISWESSPTSSTFTCGTGATTPRSSKS